MDKKLNVLIPFFTGQMRKGGVGKYILTLAGNLNNTTCYDYKGKIDLNKVRIHEKTIWHSLFRKLLFFKTMLFLKKFIKKNQIQLVHINPSLIKNSLQRDYIVFKIVRKLTPTIVFFHGWNPDNEYLLDKLPKFRKLFDADRICVLSNTVKAKIVSFGINPDKIIVCKTMIDKEFVDAEVNMLPNSEKIKLLFLSRIEKAKGIYELLEAYIQLKRKHPEKLQLTIAGSGSELENVKAFILKNAIDDIELTGYVDGEKKIETYRNSNIYILPSYTEGMPISVLEAMAMGLPVITTPVGGLSDFFIDGEMGFFAGIKKVEDISTAVERFISDIGLLEKIGRYNLNYARQNFNPQTVAKELEMHYKNLVK